MIDFFKKTYSIIMYYYSMSQKSVSMPFYIYSANALTYLMLEKVPWCPLKGRWLFIFLMISTAIALLLWGWFVYGFGKMWDTEQRVLALRSPFVRGLFSPREIMQLKNTWLPLFRVMNTDGKLDKTITVIEHWIKEGKVSYDTEEGGIEKLIKRMEKA